MERVQTAVIPAGADCRAQDQVAAADSPSLLVFGQGDGDRCAGGVAASGEVGQELGRLDAERFAHRGVDGVGTGVRDDPVHIGDLQSVAVQQQAGHLDLPGQCVVGQVGLNAEPAGGHRSRAHFPSSAVTGQRAVEDPGASRAARRQYDRTGGVAEDGLAAASWADAAGELLGADHQGGVPGPGGGEVGGSRLHGMDEAGAGCADIEGQSPGGAEFGGDSWSEFGDEQPVGPVGQDE